MNEKRYKVYNKCKYDIGVRLLNGIGIVIKAGGFQIMTETDIAFVESICNKRKYFSMRMLVAVDEHGNELDLSNIGLAVDEDNKHLSDDEIEAMLKQPAKKVEAWLSGIEDEVELHGIYEVAKKMDLPASKLRILNEKIPDKEWIAE